MRVRFLATLLIIAAASISCGAPSPAPIPDSALTTLKDFMTHRIARDEDQALSFLSPELRQTIQYQELLPASSPRWLDYTIISAQRTVDTNVLVTVQISLAAKPVGQEILGYIQQSITFEQRGDKWVVTKIGEQKLMPTPK
jgi:hypothetical protein